eukprot:TRINITY_DN4039_c0_g2_i1.p1 TRINITY_DN4039_c0_g2~~TRINITY_DN4039_c0_g2_i1.p1  ORF type:complete len:771 (+),score=146.87 TRINITY_DN4039_c0_g2_i1:282-2594(+)
MRADINGDCALELEEVSRILKQLHIQVSKENLKRIFDLYDKDKSGAIEKDEFMSLVRHLMRKDELVPLFQKYCSRFKGLESVPDVKEHMYQVTDEPLMTPLELRNFLQLEQGVELGQDELMDLIHFNKGTSVTPSGAFLNSPTGPNLGGQPKMGDPTLTFYDFVSLIFSSINSIFDPQRTFVYQDMSKSLTEYYINSSHNTYLMSNQLTGESSVDAYVRAIEKGARCLELDCWDGDDGEPIIYHGHTLTSKIKFSEVIKAIKENSFRNCKYPMILSLEMHCSLAQQERCASIMLDIFGDKLFVLPVHATVLETYPSPEELEGYFVVKSKCDARHVFNKALIEDEEEWDKFNWDISFSEDDIDIATKVNAFSSISMRQPITFANKFVEGNNIVIQHTDNSPPVAAIDTVNSSMSAGKHKLGKLGHHKLTSFHNSFRKPKTPGTQLAPPTGQNSPAGTPRSPHSPRNSDAGLFPTPSFKDKENVKENAKEKEKVHNDLMNLITMFGDKFNIEGLPYIWCIASLDEEKIQKALKTYEHRLIEYHAKYLTRVYPKGSRIDSSNYNPIDSWVAGAQMAALNFQTNDEAMLLNTAMFNDNGCGFVLKPHHYRLAASEDEKERNRKLHPINSVPRKRLEITVVSGQQLRSQRNDDTKVVRDIVDPYVKLTLRGAKADDGKFFLSKEIKNNGFNPIWNEKTVFLVHSPEFLFLKFEIYNKDVLNDEKLGWYAIPFNCIRPGYRSVPLLSDKLNPIKFSYLLVHIKISDIEEGSFQKLD